MDGWSGRKECIGWHKPAGAGRAEQHVSGAVAQGFVQFAKCHSNGAGMHG